MARPLRIEYEGAIYHITSRGIDRREIFSDDKDREHFVQLLKEGADFYKAEIIAYCLMPNHFHFLLCTPKSNLSRFMQRLNTAYTRYFNFKYKRVGPLMQGRYKAILVGSDEYFLSLSRYIYLNPVKVKSSLKKSKVEQELILRNYKWSSYLSVLYPEKRSKYFRCEKVLEHTGGDTETGRKKYEEYVKEGVVNGAGNPMDKLRSQFLLGSEDFIKRIKDKYIKGKDLKSYTTNVREVRQYTIREIILKVAREYGIKPEELIELRSRQREARKVLIELSYRLCLEHKTLRDLGREFGGMTGAGISRVHERFQEEIRNNRDLGKRVENVYKAICE
ncbi:MAG: transposase [Elusimicrobia bacterium]|nr:transposase [Candidatus Liberimonas magnetica]